MQTNLQYRHPFFLLWALSSLIIAPRLTSPSYIVHSTFSLIFPLHLLYLKLTTPYTVSTILKGLSIAITKHLTPNDAPHPRRFPRTSFARLVVLMTVGVTYPGLLWFAAISLAS